MSGDEFVESVFGRSWEEKQAQPMSDLFADLLTCVGIVVGHRCGVCGRKFESDSLTPDSLLPGHTYLGVYCPGSGGEPIRLPEA